MPLALYMDHQISFAISIGLRRRGIDVLRTQEDDTQQAEDSDLLDRAASLGRILFTRDEDLLGEVAHRQRNGIEFYGVVFAPQLNVSIGTCISDLEFLCKASTAEEVVNQVIYLPL